MTDIHCEIQPHGSITLEPDTTAELIFSYTNLNEEGSHHVRSLALSPTWALDTDIQYDIDAEVEPGEMISLPPLEIKIPEGLGGRQGFLIWVEVRDRSVETDSYERVLMDSISRVNVRNAERHRALVCSTDDGELAPLIHRLLGNWGFNLHLVDDHQTVVNEFRDGDSHPTCVVGILSGSGNQPHHPSLIDSSATTALSHDTSVLIFVHKQTELPELPDNAFSVKVNPADPIQLERDVGPELLTIRHSETRGRHGELIERMKAQVEKKPGELANDYVNNKILSAVQKGAKEASKVGGAYAAGRITEDQHGNSEESITPDFGSDDEQWTMFRYDTANTGCPPGTGPTSPINVKWAFKTEGSIISSPVVVDGTVYVGSADHSLYAIDAATGQVRWTFETDGWVRSSPAVVNGTVYVGSFDQSLYAVNAATGQEQWSFETGVRSSPTVVDGTVYIGSTDHLLYAVDAATGQKRWTFESSDSSFSPGTNDRSPLSVANSVYSSPAVVSGTVYIGSTDHSLYAIDAATGQERWSFETGDEVHSSPAVVNGTVYVGSFDQSLYAVNAVTGQERWTFDTGEIVTSSPAVVDGTAYVGSADHSLYAVDAVTGQERWTFETGEWVHSSPAVVDGIVYVGSLDQSLYALDAATGRKRGTVEMRGVGVSSPAVVNGAIYVGSVHNSVYTLVG